MLTRRFGHPIGAVTASCGPSVSPEDDRGSQGQPSSGECHDSGRDATQTANCHCAYSSVAGRMFRRSPRQWPYTRRVRSSLADTSSRAMNRLGVTTTESAMQVGTLLEAAADGDERAWSELVAQFHGLLVGDGARVRAVRSRRRRRDADDVDAARRAPGSDHPAGGVARLVGIDNSTRGDLRLEACATSAASGPARQPRSRRRPQRRRPARCGPNAISELRAAFRRLGEQCRLLLAMLSADARYSYDEISSQVDIPVGSIGPTRRRCLTKLAQLMDQW